MKLPGQDVGWKKFLKALYAEWSSDNASDIAGAVTFFAILALFPFLAFLLGIAGLVITPEQVDELVAQLGTVAPEAVTTIVRQRLHDLAQSDGTGLLTVGGLGALWATSGGITAVMRALNTAYDVEEGRPFWKVRLIAIGMAFVLAALAIASAIIVVAVPPLAERLGEPLETVILIARIPVAALLMLLAWALAYYVLPDVEQDFTFITPGSLVGVAVWLAASWGFSVYVRNFGSYDATYGSIGAAVVLLMWIWISAQVLLLGAEINAVIEHMSEEGKRPGAKSLDDTGTGEAAPPRVPARSRPLPQPSAGRARPVGIATFLAAFVSAAVVRRALRSLS